ncbi:MAG: carboxypeptidase-like regulatory domain-containing protein [Bacteroidia bacterium]
MKLFCIIFFTTIMFCQSLAQHNIVVKGKVIDAVTLSPIPYASVFNKELSYYTLADSTGKFNLVVNPSSENFYLVISSMAYISDTIIIEKTNSDQLKTIPLKPDPKNLPVASVDAMTAKTIVSKAILLIDKNYTDSTFIFNTTYVQYHFEKNNSQKEPTAVRLIFADGDILQQLSGIDKQLKPKEKVKINKVLRSNVYEKNKEEHGDHLMDLLEENPVYHAMGTVLNIKAISYYRFSFDTQVEGNTSEYKINYELLQTDKPKLQRGYLMIDKNNFAVTAFYKEEYNNSNVSKRAIYSSTVPYKWNFKTGSTLINYKNKNGKYFLKSCYQQYEHQLIDNKTHSPAYTVTECFELNVSSIIQNEITNQNSKNFTAFSNLYTIKTIYDESFYQKFLKFSFYFLDKEKQQQFMNDLEQRLPLDEQFKKNCR